MADLGGTGKGIDLGDLRNNDYLTGVTVLE
jgi:hypothetical protein